MELTLLAVVHQQLSVQAGKIGRGIPTTDCESINSPKHQEDSLAVTDASWLISIY